MASRNVRDARRGVGRVAQIAADRSEPLGQHVSLGTRAEDGLEGAAETAFARSDHSAEFRDADTSPRVPRQAATPRWVDVQIPGACFTDRHGTSQASNDGSGDLTDLTGKIDRGGPLSYDAGTPHGCQWP
jgi:hypothetical protein